jgi:hypothetical protein
VRTTVDLPTVGRDGTIARCDLLKALEADPRFRRDSLLGGIFHLGRISYREISPTDSLHIVILGDKVSAHVDEISPLRLRADGSSRYAWGRVLAHNLLVLIGDAARRLRGRHGGQRCDLHCEAEWFDDAGGDGCDDHDHDHDHEAA